MNGKGYFSSDGLFFSAIYGSGIYQWSHKEVQDSFAGEKEKRSSPVLVSQVTGEKYFARRFQNKELLRNRYQKQIQNPPKGNRILWPVDMVLLSERREDLDSTGLLLFPLKDIYGVKKIRYYLEEIREDDRNWTNGKVRKMSVEIVQGLEDLNRSGYIYGDLHLSNIYFREDGSALLDFSDLIFTFEEIVKKENKIHFPLAEEYPLAFAEPAFVRGQKKVLNFNSQNYSLNALLFFLFFGRHAYEGRLIADGADLSKQYYYKKLLDEADMPVFIFSDNDYRNRIGVFEEEQRLIQLWERLPWDVQCLFHIALDKDYAAGSWMDENPPPVRWKTCFHAVKWE